MQALVMQRGGRKIIAEAEPDGRRWVAALAIPVTAAPGSLLGDSLALPSSLARAATAPGLLRSQSTLDTASTEGEPDPMQVDSLAAPEGDVDPAGYSSFEETDLEEDELEAARRARQAGAAQHSGAQQAAALFELARDAVLVQPWDAAAPLPAGGAAAAAAQAGEQARQQQGAQPPAAAAAEGGAHSQEWRAARRGVEWRVRWLELRLTELQHQRRHYQQQLSAEQQREAAAAQAEAAQQGAAAAAAKQEVTQQQQQGASQTAASPAAAGKPPLPPAARRRARHERQPLPGCQLPDLLQHPFVAVHSVVGARAAAAADGGSQEAGPSAVDSDDFPAEAHAALELLDQKLSSLRRQLMALQQPAAGGAFRGVQAVRLPGRPAGPGRRPGGGVFTPRSGGATPRGTPRSGSLSLYRDGSLSKRRRVQVRRAWGGGPGCLLGAGYKRQGAGSDWLGLWTHGLGNCGMTLLAHAAGQGASRRHLSSTHFAMTLPVCRSTMWAS